MSAVLAAIGLFFALNLVFVGVVVLLRVHHVLAARREGRLVGVWWPRLIGVVSGAEDPDELRALVPAEDVRAVLDMAADFAVRLRGPDREQIEAFAEPLLDVLVDDLRARSPETRAAAVRQIGLLGGDRRAMTLILALDDPSPRVSLVAARALARPGRPHRAEPILDHLGRYGAWHPGLLASMLAAMGPEAAPAFRAALADEFRSRETRAIAARALLLLRDPAAADVAASVANEDDADLVVACLRLLAVVGRSSHADAVVPLLWAPEFFIRAEAARVLGILGDRTAIPILEGMVDDPSPWVVVHVTGALQALGEREFLDRLAVSEGLAGVAAREALHEGVGP